MNKSFFTTAILLAGSFLAAVAQNSENERTPNTYMWLSANAKSAIQLPYAYNGAGKEFKVNWGMDTAWDDAGNVRRGTLWIGKENISTGRISFQPNDLVGENLQLSTRQKKALASRVNHILLSGTKEVLLNCDHEMLVADHYKTDGVWNDGGEADWKASCANYRGDNRHINWYRLIKASVKYAESLGVKVISIAPFNEPDYTPWNEGTMADFKAIAQLINEDPEMQHIRISAGNTLNDDCAMEWYNYMKPYVQEGNTHQLAGSFDNYAAFFTQVRNDGNYATADELHNTMEAMVGIEYGLQSGIWWGFDGVTRGYFCQSNVAGGARLGYAENRTAWSAASVYRMPDGRVHAFMGVSERQAKTNSYELVSTDRPVFYDGYGPVYNYWMELPGGSGYATEDQKNAERTIRITTGEDVDPRPVTEGTYIIMNKKSKRVLTVKDGNVGNGTSIVQTTYTPSRAQTYQQWKVAPVSDRIGGDFSYYSIVSAKNDKMYIDLLNWSLESNGNLIVYNGGGGTNEQWFLEYAGDGDYYIRSRYSSLYMDVRGGVITAGTQIIQNAYSGNDSQRWRILPIDVAPELTAPEAPAGLLARAKAASVELSWTANTETDLMGYIVLRAEDNGGELEWNTIGRDITGTTFLDNSAEAGHTYKYKVCAMDRANNRSEASETVSASASTARALLARYQFDGSALDDTPNQLDAVSKATLIYSSVSSLVKQGEKSLALRATDDYYLLLPPRAGHLDNFTICAWVRWGGANKWERLFDFGNGTSQYMFLTPNSGSDMRLVLKNGGEEQILSAPTLSSGKWMHLAVTMSDTDTKIYVDGEEVASTTAITIRPKDFNPVLNYIGRSQFPSDPLFKGTVDDLRIYTYALSASELTAVMTGEADAIEGISSESASPIMRREYYSVGGIRQSAPQRGINIIREYHSDGSVTTRKIWK